MTGSPDAAKSQESATRVGICFNDDEMFWWRADDGEPCPACSTEDEDYEANHCFYNSEKAGQR